jgi:outer membrane protein assembly factor BamB
MLQHCFKSILVTLFCFTLCACGTLFDKDNTPTPAKLVDFKPEITPKKLWSTHANNGTDDDYLKLTPTLLGSVIFSAGNNGTVTAINQINGNTIWRKNTGIEITAGPAAANDLVIVGGHKGEVIALNQQTGAIAWKTKVSDEVLSPPTANSRYVLIKTTNGHLYALSTFDGRQLWDYEHSNQPNLILRGGSAPVIENNHVIAGFDNGYLVNLSLNEGYLQWQQVIANAKGSFSIQRMVDIDADPIVWGGHVYAATYQGRVASVDLNSGRMNWAHDISSYAGIAADANRVYVSDAQGYIWAFDAQTGEVLWQQTQLLARNVTGPAVMGNMLVVGDGQGYLHWLNKQDGHFVARTKVNSNSILVAPLVYGNTAYVFTNNGYLAAYSI